MSPSGESRRRQSGSGRPGGGRPSSGGGRRAGQSGRDGRSSGWSSRTGRKGSGGPKQDGKREGRSSYGRDAAPTRHRSGGKVPPPPNPKPAPRGDDGAPKPERTRFERVDKRDNAAKSSGKSGRSRRSARNGIRVEDVNFPGVTGATEAKLRNRLIEAAQAFEAERFGEAEQLLKSIDRLAPGTVEVHELRGLCHYRLGFWKRALNELERFSDITGSVDQHPVMADCHRAMKHWKRAEELWFELGEASPGPELIEEGRIVQAGVLADQNRLADAIRFMEKAPSVKGTPGVHHLRRWYVLADLYDRAGDNARARRLFGDIVRVNPDFGDAAERASA